MIIFSANLVFLVLIVVSFELIRKCRGDKAKTKKSREFVIGAGKGNDLEDYLLQHPSASIILYLILMFRGPY